ncbi:hypothetical protein LSCM1_00764 [Leishmania martiniquensis]|uniref:Uncharacterized protein n=1 Tax=Leishmania martiniquensis TaxID=1580590 RepID=A0A836G6Z9_9TRYP|nr:hypothetical protein LSCM1_00764 [Leishmania martiniquensis]
MHTKEVWNALLRAAECAARQVSGEGDTAVENAVASQLVQYPHLSTEEVTLVRNCAFSLARFASVCEGALQGYRACYKHNGAHRTSMYLVAYLLIFQYRALGGATVREMLEGSMPAPRLCEFVEFLLSGEAVERYAVPLWRMVYDDSFIQQYIVAPLASVAPEATRDIVKWLRGQSSQPVVAAEPPMVEEAAAPVTTHATLPPSASATSPLPMLRPLAGARLPPHEGREMGFTVPELPLPRIKCSSAPVHAPPKRAPTKPLGFFHRREVAVCPPTTANAAECSTRAGLKAAQKRVRLSPVKLRAMLSSLTSVPTTAAALWRETRARERQRENAERALQQLEVAVHDVTELDLQRQAQVEEEERRREAEVVQHHLDAVEAEERVRAQRERAMQSHHRQIQRMKAQYEERIASTRREQEEALRQHKQHVQQLRRRLLHDRAAAVEKAAADKSAIATQVREESAQLRAAAQKAGEQWQTHQALVIQDIHLLRERLREKQAALGSERRQAWVDGEADAALGRMSAGELGDALQRLRAELAAEMESRRQRVAGVRNRAQEGRELLERECVREREKQRQIRQAKQTQRMNHKAAVEAERAEKKAARMVHLHEELEVRRQAKRDAHRAAHEAERHRRNEVLLRSRDVASMERRRWSQYEAGLVRRAKDAQLMVLKEAQLFACERADHATCF